MSVRLQLNWFIGCLVACSLVACSHAPPKVDSAAAGAVSADTEAAKVEARDMTLDAQGSDSRKIEGLSSIHFAFDKSSLTDEARAQLVKNAAWMTAHPKFKLEIQGHCDRHGSDEYNLALGDRRAKAVLMYLHTLGVPDDRMSTISYGKEKMLDLGETDEADQTNRRANFNPISAMPHSLSSN